MAIDVYTIDMCHNHQLAFAANALNMLSSSKGVQVYRTIDVNTPRQVIVYSVQNGDIVLFQIEATAGRYQTVSNADEMDMVGIVHDFLNNMTALRWDEIQYRPITRRVPEPNFPRKPYNHSRVVDPDEIPQLLWDAFGPITY